MKTPCYTTEVTKICYRKKKVYIQFLKNKKHQTLTDSATDRNVHGLDTLKKGEYYFTTLYTAEIINITN